MEELRGLITNQQHIDSKISWEICKKYFNKKPYYHRKLWENVYLVQMMKLSGNIKEGNTALGFGCGEDIIVPVLANLGVKVTATDQSFEDAAAQGWAAGEHLEEKKKKEKKEKKEKKRRLPTLKGLFNVIRHPGILIDILYNRRHMNDIRKENEQRNQHCSGLDAFEKHIPHICDKKTLEANTSFEVCDMNDIDEKYHNKFDIIWSCCAFEHLGSIQQGMDFIENSMKCLKKGGIAIHTTEINVNSLKPDYNGETLILDHLVFFRKSDFIALEKRINDLGYNIYPIDYSLGKMVMDEYIDFPPYHLELPPNAQPTHIKLSMCDHVTTSIGIVIQK
jgi:2-polyprenyl-3-methyl-5-hydroxy-6-metoxy-1,4-benzoquinol methylase